MLGGIFVGGAGSRMNGVAKGTLRTPSGETIVERIARAMRDAGVEPVLVGTRAEYEATGIRAIADAASDAGPLGGLVALLEAAGTGDAIAIACDMPHVTTELVKKLASAPRAPVVAPRREGRWEPLFARYDAARVLDVARARCARRDLALQGLLDEVGAVALALGDGEARALVDWDTPADVSMDVKTQTAERAIVAFDGTRGEERADRVAIEAPLEIRLGREPLAITMRTPGDDVDLAAGFLLGEGVVRERSEIVAIAPNGPDAVSVELVESARARATTRRFFVTSSCGVCGKDSIDRVRAIAAPVRSDVRLEARVLSAMPGALRAAQAAFDRTGALHAAGLFDASGALVRFAEDVGRHNALDKVLGAEFLAGRAPLSNHAIVLSGRVAFELVQKAALAGVAIVVAIGAPTSLAIELAESANITLVGFARGARFNVYTEPSRVILQ